MGHVGMTASQPVGLRDRLAWEPLERIICSRIDPDPETETWTAGAIGAEIGVTRMMVQGYRARGTISAAHADTFAAALGLHPNLIWGHEVWEGQAIDAEAIEEARSAKSRSAKRAREARVRQRARGTAA